MINDAAAAAGGGGGHDGADPDGDDQDGDTMFLLLWLLLSLKHTSPIVVVVADVAYPGGTKKYMRSTRSSCIAWTGTGEETS